jgi:hypothetical protein
MSVLAKEVHFMSMKLKQTASQAAVKFEAVLVGSA